jgi:hypothetical protein
MNTEEMKRIRGAFNETECSPSMLVIWSRKENDYVTIGTLADAIEHSTVEIKPKLKDLFAGLK